MFGKRISLALVAVLAASLVAQPVVAHAATGAGGHVITCSIYANNPHASGHVNGTINSIGSVTCTSVVREIFIKVTLLNVNTGAASSTQKDYFNVASLQTNAAKSCAEAPATFRTATSYVIKFPPGYVPSQQSGTTYSPNTWVGCGGATLLGGSPSDASPQPIVLGEVSAEKEE